MSGIADLCARFMTAERSKALKAALAASDEAHVYGLAGSAPAMMRSEERRGRDRVYVLV